MTPDEAIKELADYEARQVMAAYPKVKKAIQLGIEALERLQDLRGHEPQTVSTVWNRIFTKLPSETEEDK